MSLIIQITREGAVDKMLYWIIYVYQQECKIPTQVERVFYNSAKYLFDALVNNFAVK